MWRKCVAAVVAWLALAAVPAFAADVSGTLPDPGIVWVSDGSHPAAMPEATMRNTHKSFQPDLLVITPGTNVRFPNDDDFFHSIYSDSTPDPFDIGFYDNGPGKLVPFARPGVNAIRCHIHGSMHGTIIVVDGPWAQTSTPNEKYVLHDVRPGEHVLHIWTLEGGEKTSKIKVAD
jgi:plastocyanin